MSRLAILKVTNLSFLVYLVGFMIFFHVDKFLINFSFGTALSTLAVLLAGIAIYLVNHPKLAKTEFWQAALVGLLIAEVFFALSFWSTPSRNKALVLIVVVFLLDQWFDTINLPWLLVFLILSLCALLLVPFQVL